MDAFKLLSRSTNLAKKSGAITSAATPSSGQNANPQLFGRASESHARPESSADTKGSRKRKRGASKAGGAVESLPADLDFFGGGHTIDEAPPQDSTDGARQNGHGNNAEAQEQSEETSSTGTTTEVMSEDERRRILRLHKVKITVLDEPSQSKSKSKSKGKSKDEEDEGSKKKKRKKDRKAEKEASSKKAKTSLYPQPLTDFQQLRSRYGISRRVAENVDAQGYSLPTEVQLGSLPLLLGPQVEEAQPGNPGTETPYHDDIDLLSVAPTGSGKTLSFLIPIAHDLHQQRLLKPPNEDESVEHAGPYAIVIAPTKELASQITNEGRKLTAKTGVKITMMRKGMALFPDSEDTEDTEDTGSAHETSDSEEDSAKADDQKPSRKKRVKKEQLVKADVIVSTPLTLLNALRRKDDIRPLESVRRFVLDEADVLLDPLFRDQTLELWNACTSPDLRVSLWSATMGSNIEELAKSTIVSRWEAFPSKIRKRHPRKPLVRLVVGLKDSAIPNISHQLTFAATEQGKLLALRQLLHPTAPSSATSKNSGPPPPTLRPPFLVFTQTIPRAVALHSELRYDIPPEAGGSSRIAVLHADLSDQARDDVMTRFRKGEVWVLITTDLLARGVDFRGVNGVVNYDFPTSTAAYVHRVGRTGRAGREGGVAVTLYTKEDVPFVKNVANVIAASEKMAAGKGQASGSTVQQWLLDALPTPTKRDKQMLKKRGIEARRPDAGKAGLKSRISTKSGFERKMEHNRKGAVRRHSTVRQELTDDMGESSEFEGFDD
jgi:ATP-dependent RNA helicase DDX52/ROK1